MKRKLGKLLLAGLLTAGMAFPLGVTSPVQASGDMPVSSEAAVQEESSGESAVQELESSLEEAKTQEQGEAEPQEQGAPQQTSVAPDTEGSAAEEERPNGLVKQDGDVYYYIDGVKQKNVWYKKDGKRYYFKSSGKRASGMTKIDGEYYYFKSNGKMVTGMKKIDGKYYYFKESGKRKTGWLRQEDGKTYYFDKKTGVRLTGKHTISHYIRYFDEKGVLYRSINKKKKMVALTYDDGPSKDTPTILNVLKKYNSAATFFVVGNRVSSYKSTVKKAYDQGCEIANHTYSHKILTRLGAAEIKSQIAKTNSTVKRITGKSPKLLRTPGGAVNSQVKGAAGMPIIFWSIDTLDWKTRSASKTASAVLNHVRDGDIVLMHDLHHCTAVASRTIIPKLVKKGYQLVTVSELAECRKDMKKGTVYSSFRK